MHSAFLFSILRFSYNHVGKTQLNVTAFYSHCRTDVYIMFRISWTESLETLTWLCRAISNLNCMKNKKFNKLGVILNLFFFPNIAALFFSFLFCMHAYIHIDALNPASQVQEKDLKSCGNISWSCWKAILEWRELDWVEPMNWCVKLEEWNHERSR